MPRVWRKGKDKLASNYAVICKRFYVESVLHDLETGGFYAGLPDTATTPAIQQVPDLLLPVVKSVVPDMFPTCAENWGGILDLQAKFPG